MTIDYRVEGSDIGPAIDELKRSGIPIDVCLVDGWHTYDESIRDLLEAYGVLVDGGVMVVHDCLPPRLEIASGDFRSGEWCGVSYRAFLDFVLSGKELDYCTVNCDYGCGIITKKRKIRAGNVPLSPLGHVEKFASDQRYSLAVERWKNLPDNDDERRYSFMFENRAQLLRLISPEQFASGFAIL